MEKNGLGCGDGDHVSSGVSCLGSGCDEGVSVEDDAYKDWSAVVGVGLRHRHDNGSSKTWSHPSSLADSDFVSLPDDCETEFDKTSPVVTRGSSPDLISSQGPRFEERDEIPDCGPNPFVNHIRISSWSEAVKVVVMTIFVLPVRLVGIAVFMLITWALARLGVCNMSETQLKESPISGWRKDLRELACLAMRAMFVFGGFHWVTIRGKQASPKDAPILVVAPHSSFFDALPVVVMGAPGLVAKGDIEKTFLFSSLVNFTQPIYVWREDPNSRQNTMKEIKRRMDSRDEWPQLLLFPEGTCSNGNALITFKPGAFYPGLPVQPVCLRYPQERDFTSWTWKGAGWLTVMWRTLTHWNTKCEIEFLPVYYPSETEKRDPVLFARNVRSVMAKALEVPVVDYTFEDCRVMHEAEKCHLPCEVGLIQTYKLCRSLGISTSDVLAELRNFANYADKRTGLFRLDIFARTLGLSFTPVEMIKLLTLAGVSGYVDRMTFREYLGCKTQVMNLMRIDERLKGIYAALKAETEPKSNELPTGVWDHIDRESFLPYVDFEEGGFERFKTAVLSDSHLTDVVCASVREGREVLSFKSH